MPPRLITAGILAFWLGMTALLLQREVVPMMLAEVAPTFQIDLADEVGSPLVGWILVADGNQVGSATSKIRALDDRRFEFHSVFHFDDTHFVPGLTTIEAMDRVTEKGKLLALSMKVVIHRMPFEIEGQVVDQKLKPSISMNGAPFKQLDLGEIDMATQANVVSSLKLVNRLRGLRMGQTWTETPLDLSRGLKNPMALDLFKQFKAPAMIAEVKLAALTWNNKEVDCHLIEYHDANKEIVARVWARKRDGAVLRRQVFVLGKELEMQRVPN